jgi:hypothetical protein
LGWTAFEGGNLFTGAVVNVGKALLDEAYGKRVKVIEIIRGV